MTLSAGTRLGPYEIISPLGAGGMGEVYRARDTRLNRDVAVKVLPAAFSKDAERLRRFELEARATSALNHPNILVIFDIGQSADSPYVVSELLEGETLGERLRSGAPGQRKAIEYAAQIARGLAAAHDKGIVHRDLKPENLFITREDRVKILDFGLAKLTRPEDSGGLETQAETGSTGTEPGRVMGTVGYMSPEQVSGMATDHRTDIFSFGTILYEMLAGQRAFQRHTAVETMTAILKEEPPELMTLGKNIAPSVARVAEHCLEKRPELRFQSAKDLAFALEALSGSSARLDSAVVQPGRSWRRLLPWSVAALGVVIAALMTVVAYRGRAGAGQTGELRLQIVTAGGTNDVTLSPDGGQLVSSGDNEGDPLSLRPLDSEVARPLPGTESGGGTFWSPDSKSIGFVVGEKLKRIDLATGAVQTLADAPTDRGASWNRQDTILFAPGGNGPLYRIPATGGQPVQVTRLRTPQEASHRFPQFLPDGNHFLFWIVGSPDVEGEYAASLDNPDQRRVCVADGPVTFLPPDHILLVRESVLYAQRFDPVRMMLTGEPVAVASGVSEDRIYRTRIAASDTGIIAFRPDVMVKRQVTWLDRTGRPDGTVGDPLAGVRGGELSPDGHTLVIHTARGEVGKPDELLMDMARGTLTPLTSERSGNARWSPDGRQIAFNGERTGILNIYSMVVGSGGPGEVVLALNEAINLSDWSPDGKYILYSSQSPTTARDVWAVPLEGADRKPFPVVQSPAEERNGRFSPDGNWVSYSSNETGREEIFVRPFPGPGPAVRVSTEGGRLPFWRRDGKELYYLRQDQLMAVPVNETAKDAVEVGMPQSLFKTRGIVVPESDGRRFLVLAPLGEAGTPPVTVIVNWADERK